MYISSYNLATLRQSILMVGSLSINFKIFRMIIRLYFKEFRKGGGHIKILKNQIQTLCANSDLLYTIVLNHTIISFVNKSLWRRRGFGGSAPNKLIASVVGTGVSLRAPVPEARLTACPCNTSHRLEKEGEIGNRLMSLLASHWPAPIIISAFVSICKP